MASSDSDSSFTDIPKHTGKTVKAKAVLQVCSDSDDDFVSSSKAKYDNAKANSAKNNSDICIKESFVDSVDRNNISDGIQIPTFEPILNIKPKRESSLDYNDTVIKNRVSLSSCTLDLDNFGDPLVESTRIHRRSSITYKQLIEEFESSPESNDIKFIRGSLKKVDEMLDKEQSVCDETNCMYITAIESVDDTLNSSESNLSFEKAESNPTCAEPVKRCKALGKNMENVDNDVYVDQPKTAMESDSESGEEIEVVDTATQTDEVSTSGDEDEEIGKETEKLIHRAYKEETIVDKQGKLYDFDNKYRDTGDLYDEDTVNDSHVNVGKQSNHELENSNPENGTPDLYSGDTIDQLGNTLASTTISTSIHNYSKETVAQESKSLSEADAFSEGTASINNKDQCDQDISIEEENEFLQKENIEIRSNQRKEYEQVSEDEVVNIEEAELDAEASIYEVTDVGTQTEDLPEEEERLDINREPIQKDFNSSVGGVKQNEENDCSIDDININNDQEDELKENTNLVEDISDESDTSERSQEEKFTNMSESSESSDAASASFANIAKKSGSKKVQKNCPKTDVTNQSWRLVFNITFTMHFS